MKKLLIGVLAAAFAVAPAFAEEKKEEKKPTLEQCKKDAKMKGCDEVLKKAEAKPAKKKPKGGC